MSRLPFIQPDCVESDYVVYAEIVGRIVALDVVVPDVVDVFPGYRQEWRILFQDSFGLADHGQALAGVDFPVDLRGQGLELTVVPERIVLRAVFAIPGVE